MAHCQCVSANEAKRLKGEEVTFHLYTDASLLHLIPVLHRPDAYGHLITARFDVLSH